jgi:hypothetical protein
MYRSSDHSQKSIFELTDAALLCAVLLNAVFCLELFEASPVKRNEKILNHAAQHSTGRQFY